MCKGLDERKGRKLEKIKIDGMFGKSRKSHWATSSTSPYMEAHNELCKLNGTEMCNSTWHSRCHPQPRPTSGSFSTDHCTLAPRLDRLMRVLVHSGFFAQQKLLHNSEEEEGYSLTFASQFLLKDEFFSGVPLLLLQLDLILAAPWHFLGDWFQNEDPTPFHTARRKSFLDYAIHEPKLNDIFN